MNGACQYASAFGKTKVLRLTSLQSRLLCGYLFSGSSWCCQPITDGLSLQSDGVGRALLAKVHLLSDGYLYQRPASLPAQLELRYSRLPKI